VYKLSKTTIKRQHDSDNEKNMQKQQSTVNNQNTEDNLNIVLRILSVIYITITFLIHNCDIAL
jgi:hypothetical protein